MLERKKEILSKEFIINCGVSDIKIDDNEKFGYAIYDRWGKKRKIQMVGSYPAIICTKNREKRMLTLHRIVYAWFIEPIGINEIVVFINGDKTDYRLENLEKKRR